jgi:acyl-coenzyme A synthetase/AMP-(fatty) acid ligase/acyl carrier protein
MTLAQLPTVVLMNMYGPTETTVFSTGYRLRGPREVSRIGRPLSNTSIAVVDSHDRLVPLGVTGELLISGEGVARGYWHRDNASRERFSSNALLAGRAYRTGDRVRYLNDGSLQFVGRADTQVKVRGVRIEIAEVESALRSCQGVAEAVAGTCVRDDEVVLGAAVVAASGAALSPRALRLALASTLPTAMLPSIIAIVPELPRTTSGKIDRNRICADLTVPSGQRPRPAHLSPIEARVAKVWERVLGLTGIGPDDDFFDLGGHSLNAAQLIARLNRAFGIKLSLRSVYSRSTLHDISELIELEVSRRT